MATLPSKLGSYISLRLFRQYSVSLGAVFDSLFTLDSYCHCRMDCRQNGSQMGNSIVLDRLHPMVDPNGNQGEACFVRGKSWSGW
jgi:hypothetical protein